MDIRTFTAGRSSPERLAVGLRHILSPGGVLRLVDAPGRPRSRHRHRRNAEPLLATLSVWDRRVVTTRAYPE
ncbi:MAG TPA: hypothetical protein VFC00_18705 [Micromonosporaceae bacterium]|nr:hypothetical protein [Micromonosporaceae bacterium]